MILRINQISAAFIAALKVLDKGCNKIDAGFRSLVDVIFKSFGILVDSIRDGFDKGNGDIVAVAGNNDACGLHFTNIGVKFPS